MVSIILVNYKGWNDSIECIESLLKLSLKNFQIILVDNASPDDSIAHVCDWADGAIKATTKNGELSYLSQPHHPKPLDFRLISTEDLAFNKKETRIKEKLIIIKSKQNNGFSAGNNIGIDFALANSNPKYIWLLNNDTVVPPLTLEYLLESAESYEASGEKVGIIGAKLLHYYKPQRIQAIGGKLDQLTLNTSHLASMEIDKQQYDYDVSEKIDYPVGASMFVNTDFIKEVGLMAEEYFLYYEELDWVHRGKAKSWRVGHCWKAAIYHKEGESIGSNSEPTLKSEMADYYALRSKLLFLYKFYPFRAPLVYLTITLTILNRIKRRQFNRIPRILALCISGPEKLKRSTFNNKRPL